MSDHISISPETLVMLLGSFGTTAVLVVANFIVRKANKWYYTAGSDFLFTEMGFSFAAAILWKDMAPYAPNPYIRATFGADFTMLGLVILCCWLWTVSRVEPMIYEAIRRGEPASALRQRQLYIAWSTAAGFFGLQIMTFLFKGGS